MSRGPTRTANPCRLVRCSAGCGTMVWHQGALPVAGDADFVCSACMAAKESGTPQPPDRQREAFGEYGAGAPAAPPGERSEVFS